MKKSLKPILLAISILMISASIAGCADSEKTADNPVVKTENTSTSSSSAEESVISSTTATLNPYDTSKPIDTTTPPASSSTASSTTSEPEESSTNSGSGTGTGEGTNSSSNSTPSSSSSTPSSSSSSSSSSTSTTKPAEKPSSSSGTGAISPITGKPITITIPAGTPGEYFDQYGNPMPDGFDPSKGGYYNRYGDYNMTPEEKAAMDRALQEIADKVNNGTLDPTAGMTKEDGDELADLFGF